MIGKKHREKLKIVLSDLSIEIYADENLITEISEVSQRDKFKKYVTGEEIELFVEIIIERLIIINPSTVVEDSPDPDDNYLLSIAIDAQAQYIITGDKKDLLALSPYRGIQIVRLQTFLDILKQIRVTSLS
ncbi:MAG: putative toxin-antitoxin system toxin component, PIN family, partial [Bacteroidetes bacterium]|nr:putative toxin-antitoxin system toxin component, PIN family [Bacteroidota bacterium]